MDVTKSSRPGRRPRFDRATVLAAALGLIDRDGAAALSMRRLASELGMETMSLYTYVANREALLDGIAELLVEQMTADPADDWRTAAENFAHGVRRTAADHPQAFELAGMRPLRTENSLRRLELLLAPLRTAGLDVVEALAAARLLTAFARGYALTDIAGFSLLGSSPDDIPEELAHLREATANPEALDPDDTFRRSLAILLDGLDATIARKRS